jgi:hypothetical protein
VLFRSLDQDYYDKNSEAWIGGSAAIKRFEFIIPDNDNFRAQCLSRLQRTGPGGKLQLEPKDEYMKRGFDSPHEGDAVFGAMMPCVQNQSHNLTGQTFAQEERGWVERAREEKGQYVLPAESCL